MSKIPSTRISQIRHYEDEVACAYNRMRYATDPEEKARIIWELAYVTLPPIEDLRPAGGFGSGSLVPAPKPGLSLKVLLLGLLGLLLVVGVPCAFLFLRYKLTHP